MKTSPKYVPSSLLLLPLLITVTFTFSFQPLVLPAGRRNEFISQRRQNSSSSQQQSHDFRRSITVAFAFDKIDAKNDDEIDYQIKLKEAEKAIAAAEEAREKLLQSKNKDVMRSSLSPPPNSLAKMEYTDAGTLIITIPRKGLGSESLFSGAFSLVWFSTIVPATFSGVGVASLAFMIPFWLAGGMVAKKAVFDPFVSGNLSIGKFAWSVENSLVGKKLNGKEGPTEQLRGAKAEVVAVVNDVPQAEMKLYTDKGMAAFGLGLSIEELEYLAGEINDHLKIMKTENDSETDDSRMSNLI